MFVGDIDDVLLPQLGNTYLEEFRRLTLMLPRAVSYHYRRFNTEVMTSASAIFVFSSQSRFELFRTILLLFLTPVFTGTAPLDYSLSSLLEGAYLTNHSEPPKYVTRARFTETTWIHSPQVFRRGFRRHYANPLINMILHLRNWTMASRKVRDC